MDQPVVSQIRHPELFFPDGSVVISAQQTLFKVYIGVLALNSEVFRDMFSIASGTLPADAPTYDGCPLIQMPDEAIDLERFLKALFINGYMDVAKSRVTFGWFSSILRMSTKYMVTPMRLKAMSIISKSYPTGDNILILIHPFAEDGFETFSKPHPIAVVNLFRQCEVEIFLPAAFFSLCRNGLKGLFTPNPGDPLSYNDMRIAVLGTEALRKEECRRIKGLLGVSAPGCVNPLQDEAAMRVVMDEQIMGSGQKFSLSSNIPTPSICDVCRAHIGQKSWVYDKELWSRLPTFFELRPWTELANGDPNFVGWYSPAY